MQDKMYLKAFIISIALNLTLIYFYAKVVKPYIDEASKGISQMICPECKFNTSNK